MTKHASAHDPPPQRGAGCFSAGIVFVVILFIVGAVLNGQPSPPPTTAPAATAWLPTLAPVALLPATPTLKPTATQTATQTPTATETETPSPTPTATNTETPSPTPTAVSTEPIIDGTPLPPTLTPTLTPTATPLPLPTPQGVFSWTLKVPILMYHYISVPPEDADIYRTDLSVTPDNFRAQMAYLAQNGYTPIDLYDLSRAIVGRQELPPRPVILTFDDGYVDNYVHAFPILQSFGFKGTFFVVTEFIDFGRPGYLTWEMVAEMVDAGMRFESHSRSHPDLSGQPRDYLIWQILGSQETLTYHLGYTPRYFSYPSGRYDQETIDLLQELNFWGAVVTSGGKWHGYDDRFTWQRLRVRHTTPLPEFIDLVDPGDAVGGQAP